MTIIEKIKASIQAVHGSDFPVYYDDEPGFNLTTGDMTFPCALVQLITTGNLDQSGAQLKEVVSAGVFFVDLTKFDADAETNEGIIDACKQRALSWFAALPLDDYLSGSLNRTARVYQQYDDIVTGFGLFVDLTELQGWTNCPELVGDFNNDFNNDFNK